MAVSRDGFLCRGPDDDMKWTGTDDKRLFRLLTSVGGGQMYAGARTADLMKGLGLPGRTLIRLSRSSITLQSQYHNELRGHREGWLIGGPTVVCEALAHGCVSEVHLSRVDATIGDGVPLAPILQMMGHTNINMVDAHRFGDCVHEVWRYGA